jgi:hypothetical protein
MKAYKILKLGEWVVVQEAYTNKKGETHNRLSNLILKGLRAKKGKVIVASQISSWKGFKGLHSRLENVKLRNLTFLV